MFLTVVLLFWNVHFSGSPYVPSNFKFGKGALIFFDCLTFTLKENDVLSCSSKQRGMHQIDDNDGNNSIGLIKG